jgi:hypothetical protein
MGTTALRRTLLRLVAVVSLFILGFWIMAAGGIVGSGVHMEPTIGSGLLGGIISTLGLGVCLSGLAVARSRLTRRMAEALSCVGVLYGFYCSLINIIHQSDTPGTLLYGMYMSVLSIIGVLAIRRLHMKANRVVPIE